MAAQRATGDALDLCAESFLTNQIVLLTPIDSAFEKYALAFPWAEEDPYNLAVVKGTDFTPARDPYTDHDVTTATTSGKDPVGDQPTVPVECWDPCVHLLLQAATSELRSWVQETPSSVAKAPHAASILRASCSAPGLASQDAHALTRSSSSVTDLEGYRHER